MWYHVAEPNSYLVITGAGIPTVKIKKKSFVLPLQKVAKISVTPFDFSMSLHAMTIEKLKFSLPAVFTIGPHDELSALEKYAVLLTGRSDGRPIPAASDGLVAQPSDNHVQNIVKGIIEGETRGIVSTMTMEELFRERQVFKRKVIDSVQSELEQFGLRIYNANVKELQDTPGSEYFAYLSRKAHEDALNQAKIDVADARMRGEVGEAEKQGKAKQELAKLDAQTAVLETERKAEKARADARLTEKEILLEKDLNLARIDAQRASEQRDIALQEEVERKRADTELERLRASTVIAAKIARESAQQKADADLYTKERAADATRYQKEADTKAALYRQTQDAEASYVVAQHKSAAESLARRQAADAEFYAAKKEADGMKEKAAAISDLMSALGGPQALFQYLMLDSGAYEKLASENAKAINGLAPKINIWNTANNGSEIADATAPIRNLFQSLPPLLASINDQTGIQPPDWLAKMPQHGQEDSPTTTEYQVKNSSLANGHTDPRIQS